MLYSERHEGGAQPCSLPPASSTMKVSLKSGYIAYPSKGREA
ncbi:hypothetical protein GA0061098_103629 [Bradyrhizobium shewense]|uniref:Uncharacterized protein n=1 Tax=Bradyrhizobium shewense TaxID=1761772 RepID=A0A1C3XSD6_9BRAD|nr:hypothetical protein GA0061098_103629 [Bradyrhizobium shewense]